MIGPENLRYFLNQSDAKLKPMTTWSSAFSRLSGSFEFLLAAKVFSFFLIGRYDYFGLGFTTINRKAL